MFDENSFVYHLIGFNSNSALEIYSVMNAFKSEHFLDF
jgi:hypothetical protein